MAYKHIESKYVLYAPIECNREQQIARRTRLVSPFTDASDMLPVVRG